MVCMARRDRRWRVINRTTGALVAGHVREARSFTERLVGLMFRPSLPWGHGLLIRPCNAIHTLFMRFPIDAVYLGPEGRVLRVDRRVKPWRVARPCPGAAAVLELPAGGAAQVSAGHVVEVVPAFPAGREAPGR